MTSLILRHLSGSKANQESVFSEEELAAPITLGRDPASRLSFGEADDAASRNHARLERTPDGYKIVDLKSANGLFLNGARVTGESVLRHGDIPNLAMPPMTMGFDVADPRMLDGLKMGDKVRFQAEMVKGKATVIELKRETAR